MCTLTTLIAPIATLSMLSAPVGAQRVNSGSAQDAMKLARELARSYVASYNAHDAAKLAARYAPDADWVSFLGDEVGSRLEGRAAIERYYHEFFASSPQVRVEITPEHARLVTPNVLIGDYSWSLTDATRADRPRRGRATVVDLRRSDKWQICCARLFMAPTSAGAGAQQTASNPDKDAMRLARELNDSFVAAYNAHDAAKLAARYAPDADWVSFLGDEVGSRLEGRAAIERNYREAFARSPQVRAHLTTEYARLVTPEMIIFDLAWSVTNSTGTDRPSQGRCTVISLRLDGDWQNCCVRLVMTPRSGSVR